MTVFSKAYRYFHSSTNFSLFIYYNLFEVIFLSKLYKKYLELKQENSNNIYIFKSGMFYICLEDDAKKLSEIFSFKLTNLNSEIVKCGFPQNRLDFYLSKLNDLNVSFEIVDDNYFKIDNYSDYLNNSNLKLIVQNILNIDLNEISFKQAYSILENLQKDLKNLK